MLPVSKHLIGSYVYTLSETVSKQSLFYYPPSTASNEEICSRSSLGTVSYSTTCTVMYFADLNRPPMYKERQLADKIIILIAIYIRYKNYEIMRNITSHF